MASDLKSDVELAIKLGQGALNVAQKWAAYNAGKILVEPPVSESYEMKRAFSRFKNGSRVFPPESDRPAITTWKILRALLSTPHNLGVTLLEIKNPASVMQRKKNRAVTVETWQDHVLACDKFGNPVNRGNGKHMYRLMLEPVR